MIRQVALQLCLLTVFFGAGRQVSAEILFPLPQPQAAAYEYVSGLLCYIEGGLRLDAKSHEDCLASAEASMDDAPLSTDLRQALQELAVSPHVKPLEILSWWDEAQLPTIVRRRQNSIISQELADFQALTKFVTWPRTILKLSMVKRLTRVIYRSPDGVVPAMSVAVTYDSQTGDLTAPVLETEIALERMDGSGNADFYAYDDAGHLSRMSTFPSGERPVPSSCMGCHFRKQSRTFPREGL